MPERTPFADDKILHPAVRSLGHLPLKTKIELLVLAAGDDVAATALCHMLQATVLNHPAFFRKLTGLGVHPLIRRCAIKKRHKVFLFSGSALFLFSQDRCAHGTHQGNRCKEECNSIHHEKLISGGSLAKRNRSVKPRANEASSKHQPTRPFPELGAPLGPKTQALAKRFQLAQRQPAHPVFPLAVECLPVRA